jgi:hypothetical protein
VTLRPAIPRRARALVLALASLGLVPVLAACVKRGEGVEVARPLSANLASYWTCAVTFASDGRGEDANEAFTFVPWFESRVRERAVFEPLGKDELAEAEVTLRLTASHSSDDRVSLHVVVFDTKTREPLGELDALGVAEPSAVAADPSEPQHLIALRNAADRILEALKARRGASASHAKRPAPPPVAEPDPGPVAGSAVCMTECHPPSSSASSHAEEYRVSGGINATMKELRDCLDRVGAQLVVPAVLLRFSPDGRLRHMRVDVGGYENLECIQAVRARPSRGLWTSRASLLRCEYRCTTS